MVKDLNPLSTPFEPPNPEFSKDIIYETHVNTNLNTFINNSDDFYSTIYTSVNDNELEAERFITQTYNLGLDRLIASQITSTHMNAQRVPLTEPDEISIRSIMTLPEPVIEFSRINLPETTLLKRN